MRVRFYFEETLEPCLFKVMVSCHRRGNAELFHKHETRTVDDAEVLILVIRQERPASAI